MPSAWLSSRRTDGSVRALPRGVLRTSVDGRIEGTGPLNRKRKETIDDETNAAMDFMERQVRANRPFFSWINTTRMHAFTHVQPSMQGQSGMSTPMA
jgi:hypothetical protein